MELPKVLVVSTNAWRDNTGIHTLIELFSCWDPDRLAQLYTKSVLPSTRICHRFFQISENAVLRSVWRRRLSTGRELTAAYRPSAEDERHAAAEATLYRKGRAHASWLLGIAREFVWKLGRWKTPELDAFLRDYKPDVLFLPIYPTIYMNRLQAYVQKQTGCPAVCYLADDNYTYKPLGYNPFSYIHRFFLRRSIRKVVSRCARMFVIAPKQKREYDRLFGTDSILLTKGIDVSSLPSAPRPAGDPLRLVYTGKLIIGRWKSLAAIAEALGAINADRTRMTLDIYTTDPLNKRQQALLNRNGAQVRGAVPLSEVEAVQRAADVLVFVESLDRRYRQIARLSFSTKLTDYLKSGRCIFAIGDRDIAPIEYLRQHQAAEVATSYGEILPALRRLADSPETVVAYGERALETGRRYHDQNAVFHTLTETLIGVTQHAADQEDNL